eukprot:295153-Hanusia_phi.AAC.2
MDEGAAGKEGIDEARSWGGIGTRREIEKERADKQGGGKESKRQARGRQEGRKKGGGGGRRKSKISRSIVGDRIP